MRGGNEGCGPLHCGGNALGAAYLAGFQAGICPDFETLGRTWRLDRRFVPEMAPDVRERRYAGWLDVVRRTTTIA